MDVSRREFGLLALALGGTVALKPENPLVGGTVLRRAAIQSPNFVTGVSGWTVKQDGSSEFNNVTVRGTVTASRFIGNGNGQEIVIYRGTPAAGNVLCSMISSQVSDIYGNALLADLAVYGNGGSPFQACRITEQGVSYYTAASQAGPWNVTASANWDTVTSRLVIGGGFPLALTGGLQAASGLLAIGAAPVLQVDNAHGSVQFPDLVAAPPAASGPQLYAGTTGNLAQVTPAGLTGSLPAVITDTTTPAASNNTVAAAITASYTIPANDSKAGTVYEIEVPFNGTAEGQTIQWGVLLDSTSRSGTTIGSAFFSLGAAFDGHVKARMLVRNTGAAGQVDFSVSGGVGLTGTRSSGTNNNNAYLSAVQANVAHDTTVSHTLAVYAVFGAAAAGQLVTGHGSVFTRKGP